MQTIICTSGTSIAGSLAWTGDETAYRAGIRKRLVEQADKSKVDILHHASAETNSMERLRPDPKQHRIALLHSETVDGKICAEEVADLVRKHFGLETELFYLNGLQVDNAQRFRLVGIQSIFETLDRLRQRDWNLLLNVTGGFKSVVPYMTLYGQIHQIEVVYIFERSNQLIRLPPAPINFDFERLKIAEEALRWLGEESVGSQEEFFQKMPQASHEDKKWCETLLEKDGESVTLSAFGIIMFNALRERPADVFVYPRAMETYQKYQSHTSGEQFRHMLSNVSNPLWRQQKIHHHSSELLIFKPGNTGERMGCFLKDGAVYVARLWQSHDQYLQEARAEKIKDYPIEKFTLWNNPA